MLFRILGALEAGSGGRTVDLGPPKQRALLTVLLLHVREIVPTDRLIELLWGDDAPRTASHSVQIYVSELRKALQPLGRGQLILTRPPGYVLDTAPELIDAHGFRALVDRGLAHIATGDSPAGAAALRQALELWRGPALSDFVYEEFAQPYIRRLTDVHLDAIEALAAAELEMGRPNESLALLEIAIREDALRERLRELLMLALYRAGRHTEALRNYQQFRTLLDEELGLEPSPPLRRLQERILIHDETLLPTVPAARADVRNPYKGLRPFGEDDADDFFGRDVVVEGLLERLRGGHRLISLVGPSGAGKSSVVAGGLIPRLRQGAIAGSHEWLIATIVPGVDPLAEAESAIARLAPATSHGPGRQGRPDRPLLRATPEDARVVLLIDQFEEVFSTTEQTAREQFLRAISGAVGDSGDALSVVLTLRADYYDRPLLDPDFAAAFLPSVVNVLPMSAHELEAAIVKPAERVGVTIESSLLAELVADAAGRPGGLPLLQYALTELFEQRTEAVLTHSSYRSLGGLQGVLSRRAEALYGELDADGQRAAMQVFLRLVGLAEGTVESRRRRPLVQLADMPVEPVTLSKVLNLFGRHRLLSFDRDLLTGEATVEVAHEALFREWSRLAGWIERHRTSLWRRDVLTMAVEEWELAGRNPDYLLSGSRLAEFDAWRREGALQLTKREHDFLEAGLARSREQRDEGLRLEREQRTLRRRARWSLVGLSAAVALLVVAAVSAALAPRAPSVALLHQGTTGFIDRNMREAFARSVTDLGLDGREHFHTPVADDEDHRRRQVWTADLRRISEQGYGLMIAFDVNEEDVVAVARDFPDRQYVTMFYKEAANLSAFHFEAHETAYLAGAAAALTSESGIIGFLGGMDIPYIWPFEAGYEAGARAVNPDIQIVPIYLAQFGDPEALAFDNRVGAFRDATEIYRRGADVIMQAAGASGPGVFDAAATYSTTGRHVWAIGVDEDQYETITRAPGVIDAEAWRRHILTSVVLRFDRALTQLLEEYAGGSLTPGLRRFDLASGFMELSYSGGYLDDVRPELETLRQGIANGEISVYCYPAEKEAMALAYMQANPGGWELPPC